MKLIVTKNRSLMKDDCTYFIEKASILVRTLIGGEGNAKQRLIESEFEISLVLSMNIPVKFKPKRDDIKERLNKKSELKVGEIVTTTKFRNTVHSLRNKTAGKLILDIYDLFNDVVDFDSYNHNK